jgi:hypothetical protein
MPKIAKSSPKPKPVVASNGSLLSRFVPVDEYAGEGIHIVPYGRTKTGKTRLMATFPKPIAFLMADQDGELSIKGTKDVKIIQVVLNRTLSLRSGTVDIDELRPLIAALSESEYKTICLDTITSLQEIILAKLCNLDEVVFTKKADMMPKNRKQEYIERAEQIKIICNDLLKLHDKHICISAHEKDFNRKGDDDAPAVDYGDVLTPSFGPSMSKSPAEFLCANASYVCHTFIREKTETVTSEAVPGKPITMQRKIGGMEYCLRVGPDAIYNTGFRLIPGAELPDVIVNPTFQKILNVTQGKKVGS